MVLKRLLQLSITSVTFTEDVVGTHEEEKDDREEDGEEATVLVQQTEGDRGRKEEKSDTGRQASVKLASTQVPVRCLANGTLFHYFFR